MIYPTIIRCGIRIELTQYAYNPTSGFAAFGHGINRATGNEIAMKREEVDVLRRTFPQQFVQNLHLGDTENLANEHEQLSLFGMAIAAA